MEKQEMARRRVTEALTRLGCEDVPARIEEFKLLTVQEEVEVLREVARLINERIDSFAKMLEDFLQPDAHIASMNEIGFLSEQEMDEVITLYREMMRLFRHYTRATLLGTRDAHGAYITAALQRWSPWRTQLLALVERLERGWQSGQPLQTERSYFG